MQLLQALPLCLAARGSLLLSLVCWLSGMWAWLEGAGFVVELQETKERSLHHLPLALFLLRQPPW